MRALACGLVLLGSVACLHAQTTDASPDATKTDSSTRAPPATSSKSATLPANGTTIASPGHPTLAVSAEALRKPGGTAALKKALAKAGFLSDGDSASEKGLHDAIVQFQAKNDMAQTGFADHETLRKLGLNPDDIDLSQMPRNSTSTP